MNSYTLSLRDGKNISFDDFSNTYLPIPPISEQKRIVELQEEKGITNYRIYKSLNLNPGNVNAFLKNGDVSKMGLNTVRKILEFVNDHHSNIYKSA